ncbi:MAG: AMP-binding protein [Chloroflexi bacterium]|nr:AMP-binding protein [Chloroflexota bacterium]
MAYTDYWNPRIETLPLDELRDIQNIKLQKQMRYVYERSPFYRRKFDSMGVKPEHIRSVENLAELPFTTKEELRESQAECPPLGLHMAADLDKVVRVHSSSGTTGRPVFVGITEHDRQTWIEIVSRVWWTQGTRPTSRMMIGFSMGIFVGGLTMYDGLMNIGAMFIPIGTGASERLLDTIQAFNADILCCTPSYAIYLAEYARNKAGLDPSALGIKRIQCGAEPGGGVPGVRDRIAADWNAIVTESVGSADVSGIYAAQCDELHGNHFLAPDYVVYEIIDPDTGKVLSIEDGVKGEIVITHIDRECVPLVRYRLRDYMLVQTKPCKCGRTGHRLQCVGRTDDMLLVLGVNVFPSAVKDVVSKLRPKTTGEIQILLDKPGPKVEPPLKVRVEHGPDVQDLAAVKKEVEETIRGQLVCPNSVELVPPGTLPRYEMKAQLIKKLYE